MASYYVWSGATGSANGTSWANAYTTLVAGLPKAAGDTFYLAHDHSEITAGTVALTVAGTVANPTKLICVNRAGSVPPVSADRRATAVIATSVNNNINFDGFGHYDGIIFIAGNSTGTATINLAQNSTRWLRFDNCSLRIGSTGTGGSITFAGSFATYLELNNTTLSFANASQRFYVHNTIRWRNTPSALLGTILTTVFQMESQSLGSLECIGVDLSAAGSGITLCGTSSNQGPFIYRFIDCKLDANVTKAAVPLGHATNEIDFIRCGATGVNYTVHRQRMSGLLTEETVIVRTGGASDGTTTISWKIVTTANCSYSMPFECSPIAIWNTTVGSAKTATIEGIWSGGALPLNDEIFLELEYLGSGSSPQASFASNAKADLLATAAAQPTSSATWNSMVTARANSTAYTVGQAIKVASNPGRVFICTSAGTSAASEPTTGGTTILNTADKTAGITLSGGNLTAVASGSSQAVRSNLGQGSRKFYFEVLVNNNSNGVDTGIASGSTTLANWISQVSGILIDTAVGNIRYNGSGTSVNLGTISNGQRICCAVDMTNLRLWMRVNAGNWNGNASYDPATNVGGVDISSSFTGVAAFAMVGGGNGSGSTSNFGATAFTYTVPSGFSGGPTQLGYADAVDGDALADGTANFRAAPCFKLSTTFTAQQAGFIYARVKCAKPSSTFYIDPLITLT